MSQMSTFVEFEIFSEDLAKGKHQLHAAGHTLKVCLSNTAPDIAIDTEYADIVEIASGFGYTTGGADIQNDISRSGGITSVTGVDVVWTATGGDIGPLQYLILYNDSASGKPLIGYWDLGTEQIA